ncbi:solute carrier family 66 member 3-like isoform X1 [Acipenser ruthenus]|uniref:solute carrier family 66 member 3-like isoform X1 n=1 Tax=Acipenser ruthenus TaxID=7906 RepID=UPI002740DB33|nr:solute carrier family 66 member 3-like isoform X1 [Acipenser ruthenus]
MFDISVLELKDYVKFTFIFFFKHICQCKPWCPVSTAVLFDICLLQCINKTVLQANLCNSLLLYFCCRYIVVLSYQSYYEYPLSAYLEYPILIAQDVILLVLVFYYNGNLSHCLLPAVLFVAVWPLITFQKWIIDLAMSLCTFISAASKFAQLQCLWEIRDAGQVSALTWGMAIYTSLARIFTTLMTTGDFQVLARFLIMLLLNGWVTATIVYYRRAGIKQE